LWPVLSWSVLSWPVLSQHLPEKRNNSVTTASFRTEIRSR